MTHIIQYLSKAFTTSSLVLVGMITLFSFLPSQDLSAEDDDVFTDIILINGQAELADFNKDGEILSRHVVVPDYFTSGRSHKRSLRNSLKKLKVYGSVETPKPLFYHAPVECRQSLLAVKEVKTPTVSESTEISVINSLIQLSVISDDYLSASNSYSNVSEVQLMDRVVELSNKDNLFLRLPKQRLKIVRRSRGDT